MGGAQRHEWKQALHWAGLLLTKSHLYWGPTMCHALFQIPRYSDAQKSQRSLWKWLGGAMKKGLRTTWTLVMNSGSAIHRFMSLNIFLSSSIFFHKMQINIPILIKVVAFQILSCVWLFAPPWTAACQASLSFNIFWSCLKITSIKSVMPSNHLVLCHPLLHMPLSFPASGFFPMSRIFALVGLSIGASALASVLPMNIQGWFPLGWIGLILQSKGLLHHHSLKTSVLQCSVYFMVQLSHPYMTTGKTIALTRWTFVQKVMSLLFNPV